MTYPDFSNEKLLWNDGFSVIGIDEAGRGAFAGPLSVGGVVLNQDFESELAAMGINDSKLLTPLKREGLFSEIIKYAYFWHVEFIPVDIINEIGIGKATFLGMHQVINNLKFKIKNSKELYALVDAFQIPGLKIPQKPIVHGDRLSISIAAASILAKVVRDKYMVELSLKSPKYGFEKHKGYGTKFHREMLTKYGLTQDHRIQFCQHL